MDLALGREDQRVDLYKVSVAFDITGVQLLGNGDCTVASLGVQIRTVDPLSSNLVGETVDRVNPDLADLLGGRGGNLFDVHATFGTEHAQVLFCSTIECEAHVVLLGDIRGSFDPQPFDDVALDVKAEDVGCVLAHCIHVGRELNAAQLAPATGQHLRLHHHRSPEALGRSHRFVDGKGNFACRNWHAVLGEELFALILEQIHHSSFGKGLKTRVAGWDVARRRREPSFAPTQLPQWADELS